MPSNKIGITAHQARYTQIIGRALVGSGKECIQIPAPHSSATSLETTVPNPTSFLHFFQLSPTLGMASYRVTDVAVGNVCLGAGGRIESTSPVLILSLTPVRSNVKFGRRIYKNLLPVTICS